MLAMTAGWPIPLAAWSRSAFRRNIRSGTQICAVIERRARPRRTLRQGHLDIGRKVTGRRRRGAFPDHARAPPAPDQSAAARRWPALWRARPADRDAGLL